MTRIRIATRTSALAMIQTKIVAGLIERGGATVEIVGISTKGDRVTDRSLALIGGDGIFTKELEAALLDGRADVAVHSLKDLPTALAAGTRIGAVLEREDARDVLVSPGGAYGGIAALPRGAAVGTSSLRRKALLLATRPDIDARDLRGNVDTRIQKVIDGTLCAAVLALAGVKRLGLLGRVGGGAPIAVDEMVPAVGQGAICAQCRVDDEAILAALAGANHAPTALATGMERAFLARLGGGCLVPIGAYAVADGGAWRMTAAIAAVDGSACVRKNANGTFAREAEAVAAAESIADEMLDAGGRAVIAAFRTTIARNP